jgi:phage-related protein
MAWDIEYYKTPSGHEVVNDFINSLQKIPHAKLLRELDLLETYGAELGMPHAKAMSGGLLELRVRGQTDVRVFYAFAKARRIYLLHGFIKKRQTTPKHELDIALKRKKEIEAL